MLRPGQSYPHEGTARDPNMQISAKIASNKDFRAVAGAVRQVAALDREGH